MAISTQKLLPQKTGGAIVPIKKSAITKITPIATKKSSIDGSKKDTLVVIKERCIEVDTLLKGSLALDKIRADNKRKEDQKQKRSSQEDKLESKPKGEKKTPGLKLPKIGFLDRIKKFIMTTLLGFVVVRLIEFVPLLKKLIPIIASVGKFIVDVFLGLIDGLGTFLAWGFSAWESSEKKLKKWGGDEAVERFSALGDALGNLFNAILIVGMTTAKLNDGKKPGKKPGQKPGTKPGTKPGSRPGMKPTGPRGASRAMQLKHGPEARQIYDNARANGKSISQAKAAVNRALKKGQIVSKPQTGTLRGNVSTPKGAVMKKGLAGSGKRLGVKLFGKKGIKLVSKTFGRIPVMGPLIVAVASLLAGEPIGQAVFKGLGAALGGLLGSFIPIPVIGTLLGETLGVFVGDLLYSLILGKGPAEAGQKFMTALKTAMDVGGLIVDFFKQGFGRLIDNFPMTDVSDTGWGALQIALAKVLPFLDKDKNGKVEKIPDFSLLNPILNPIGFTSKLIPHAAASFFPAIFGKDGTAFGDTKAPDNDADTSQDDSSSPSSPSSTPSGGGITTPSNVKGLEASKKGKIYLHWSAGAGMTGYPSRYHSTILADGSKVQKVPYSKFRTPGGHTAYRNSQGIGLAVAAMQDWNWSTIKPKQLDAFTTEAAKVAKDMGYSKSMINVRNVATHAEVGSMRDGQKNPPYSGNKRTPPPAPDNHGPSWSGWGGDGARSDFVDINKADYNAQKGVGGDKLRAMIKGKMRMGGPTKGRGLYMMAEEGKEFVIDADSTRALQGTFPGLLKALNKAEGDEAINVLRSYADYEMAEVIPIPIPVPQGAAPQQNSYGSTKKGSTKTIVMVAKEAFSDILYMR